MKIRTDLADVGVYVFSQHALKLMRYVDNERSLEWSKISTDVIPFFARNQFKDKLHRMLEEATKDKTKKKQQAQVKDQANRIEALFNGTSSDLSKKISINIVGHIDPMDSTSAYLRMLNTKTYMRANLEGQKLVQRFASSKGQYQLEYRLFQPTDNNCVSCTTVDEMMQELKANDVLIKDSNVLATEITDPSGKETHRTPQIGAGTTIQKSVIGHNVQIGTKAKISNSIILGRCQIGDQCQIMNSLILNKVVVGDMEKLTDEVVERPQQV